MAAIEPLGPGQRLALRTVPIAARIIGDALVTATVAFFDVATECSGATALDGAQRAFLGCRQSSSVGTEELLSVRAHNIGDFQRGTHDGVATSAGRRKALTTGACPVGL